MPRKDLIITVLLTFCITVTLFGIIPTSGQGAGDYDPWYDINDDGVIDMKDIGGVARKFGTSGTAINKTEELIQLRNDVDTLNDSVTTIEDSVLKINATLTARIPNYGYISVSTGAFVRVNYFDENFIWDTRISDVDDWGYFIGYVQLPHGSTIKALTFYWFDYEQMDIRLTLYRYNQTLASYQTLGYITSTGEAGYGYSYDTTIEYATIDNRNYAYGLRLEIPPAPLPIGNTYGYQYAVIEYEYPA